MRYLNVAAMSVLLALVYQTSAVGAVSFFTSKTDLDNAVSTTLVEDFESVAQKNTPLTTFTHNGIKYTGLTGSPFANVVVVEPGSISFGAGVPQPTSTSILVGNGNEDFKAEFENPMRAVGFDTYYNGLGPVTIQAFGNSGLLDSFTVSPGTPQPNGIGYIGFVSDSEPITSFRFTSTSGDTLNTGIDNISIAAVPEPAAYAVLLIGLGIVAAMRRRVGQQA